MTSYKLQSIEFNPLTSTIILTKIIKVVDFSNGKNMKEYILEKYISIFIITIILFFVGLAGITTFGPWKWYRISAGENNGLDGIYVTKLPVWYGSYVLRAPTERESDEAYLKELDSQIQKYKSWKETEAKKNILKWFKEERTKVKNRLDSPDSP